MDRNELGQVPSLPLGFALRCPAYAWAMASGGLFAQFGVFVLSQGNYKALYDGLKQHFEEFDYLTQGADDRAGALGFGLNVEPPAPERRFNRTLDLERLQATADAVIRDDPDLAGSTAGQVEELMLLGTSMGGARPKTVVEDKYEGFFYEQAA